MFTGNVKKLIELTDSLSNTTQHIRTKSIQYKHIKLIMLKVSIIYLNTL